MDLRLLVDVHSPSITPTSHPCGMEVGVTNPRWQTGGSKGVSKVPQRAGQMGTQGGWVARGEDKIRGKKHPSEKTEGERDFKDQRSLCFNVILLPRYCS